MKKNRRHDYRAPSTQRTRERQSGVLEWLELFGEGLTMAELASALGCSRQLALYHVKKLAASGAVVMQLEPCEANAGLRFRVWTEATLTAHYVRRFYAPAVRVAA